VNIYKGAVHFVLLTKSADKSRAPLPNVERKDDSELPEISLQEMLDELDLDGDQDMDDVEEDEDS
jgi:hypothetical protein